MAISLYASVAKKNVKEAQTSLGYRMVGFFPVDVDCFHGEDGLPEER